MSFCTLFWHDITIIWNENIVYFFNRVINSVLDQLEVYLLNFHQQTIVVSSQNNVQKDMNKFLMKNKMPELPRVFIIRVCLSKIVW